MASQNDTQPRDNNNTGSSNGNSGGQRTVQDGLGSAIYILVRNLTVSGSRQGR